MLSRAITCGSGGFQPVPFQGKHGEPVPFQGKQGEPGDGEAAMSEKITPHCWKDRTEDAAERFGFGSDQWAKAFSKGGGTCLLASEHPGPHRFTPDSKIVVKFK